MSLKVPGVSMKSLYKVKLTQYSNLQFKGVESNQKIFRDPNLRNVSPSELTLRKETVKDRRPRTTSSSRTLNEIDVLPLVL